jgi:hypothetical protein
LRLIQLLPRLKGLKRRREKVNEVQAGLPDGIFSNQKSQFGKNLECLAMKDVGKFNSQLVYFTGISYIVCTFGIFCDHFSKFFPFW